MPRDWDAEFERQRQRTETFRRIHRLYKHGFRPDWSVTDVEDAIWWMHPGDYPALILYPDGLLLASLGRATLSPNARHDKDRIYNEGVMDTAQFDSWLSSLPKASWWKAWRYARERYIWMPIGIVILYGLIWLASTGVEKFLRTIWHSSVG